MSNASHTSGRGERWFAVQVVLMVAVALSPFVSQIPDDGRLSIVRALGMIIFVAGLALVGVGGLYLGNSLTVFPRPKEDATLQQGGIYALVRHPIYSGVILAALGGSLSALSPLGLLLSFVLIAFFDRKSRREEIWLVEKFPEYVEYRKRVKRLIPWLY